MKGRKPRKPFLPGTWLRKPIFKILLSVFLFCCIIVSGVTLYYYQYYSRMIDRRLSGEVFQRTARIYAAPFKIYPGQKLNADNVVARLQRAGYEPQGSNHPGEGTYALSPGRVTIIPLVGEPMMLNFKDGRLQQVARKKEGELAEAALPAELLTSFSDDNRQKRRLVENFQELPPHLVNALIAAEDNRFFRHFGIDVIRLAGAVVQSLRSSNRIQGTSTITQQFSRNFFLTTERTWTRKANEMFLSVLLEQRLSKEQILTLYANDVYLGARGSFSIKGFGEGAMAYFGKDLTALTLPEAATLAAIIPAPSGQYSPVRHASRAKERRNMVLHNMATLGLITEKEAEAAKKTDLKLARFKADVSDAPYLVDYIRNTLLSDFPEDVLLNDSLRVETTINPDLQRIAVDALQTGIKEAQGIVNERNKKRKPGNKLPEPQAALIVIESKTGNIVAGAGGGDYGESQLNRITQAFRQPGSIFKPFVYAAAFEECERLIKPQAAAEPQEGEEGEPPSAPGDPADCITPTTVFEDAATVFTYDGEKTYQPNNYGEKFYGRVTVAHALEKSLNIPTVKIAEAIGYERVANLAKRAGLNAKIKGYPSVALGAFEVTPLEMAGAYTIFANEGKRLQPHALTKVIGADGRVLKQYEYKETPVLSPQVAFLMTRIMENTIHRGTGAGARSTGFSLPAAGKTGTSRDGWFAGYTKDYIAIAWVGFDDNTDLNIEGAKSALPIWREFMKRAQDLYPPRDPDAMYFSAPDGVVEETVLRDAAEIPARGCEEDHREVFLAGSVLSSPVSCGEQAPSGVSGVIEKGLGKVGGFFSRIFGGGKDDKDEKNDSPNER
jgi:penicillin-binding protein 1B